MPIAKVEVPQALVARARVMTRGMTDHLLSVIAASQGDEDQGNALARRLSNQVRDALLGAFVSGFLDITAIQAEQASLVDKTEPAGGRS